jgi:hypothetical protein
MPENYPSASEMVRNLRDIRTLHSVLLEEGKFRIVRFSPPYFEGYEYWVVNERGFMWEGTDSEEDALQYLESDEARDYNR